MRGNPELTAESIRLGPPAAVDTTPRITKIGDALSQQALESLEGKHG